jgi:hypothetical protein
MHEYVPPAKPWHRVSRTNLNNLNFNLECTSEKKKGPAQTPGPASSRTPFLPRSIPVRTSICCLCSHPHWHLPRSHPRVRVLILLSPVNLIASLPFDPVLAQPDGPKPRPPLALSLLAASVLRLASLRSEFSSFRSDHSGSAPNEIHATRPTDQHHDTLLRRHQLESQRSSR